MFALALALFAIIVGTFALLTIVVVFHLNRYAVQGDRTLFVKTIFLAGTALFFLLAFLAFFSVPWEELALW